MSKPRQINEINQDYARKAQVLGHLTWQLERIPREIDGIHNELKALDNEMDKAQALKDREDQEKAKAAIEAHKEKEQTKEFAGANQG
jgi:hypothetical protein